MTGLDWGLVAAYCLLVLGLGLWAQRKGAEGLAAYRAENNRLSLDGLPGLRRAGGGT